MAELGETAAPQVACLGGARARRAGMNHVEWPQRAPVLSKRLYGRGRHGCPSERFLLKSSPEGTDNARRPKVTTTPAF